MKRLIILLSIFTIIGVSSAQQVVNGVLQGSPSSFMYLPTTPPAGGWNNSWVKPSRADDGYFSSQITQGAITTNDNFTHRFIVRGPDSTNSLNNNPCFRWPNGNGGYYNLPTLGSAWNSDIYAGTYVDTVIQLGKPDASGLHAQEMIYSFIPDTNNPVLLLQFAFITEGIFHESHAPRNPGVEFALLAHGTNNFLPIGNYDASHPYSRFWFGTPLYNLNGTPDPQNTPLPASVAPQYIPKGSCPCQSDVDNVFVFPYTIVAFDLSEQASNQQAVDFRIREWACSAEYHWASCFFTAKMIPAKLKVKYCGGDSLKLDMPWGFDEIDHQYEWYNGTDANNISPIDMNDPEDSRVLVGNTYHPILNPNPAKPYYKCQVYSRTGVPFTYEATVNFYDLQPSFTVEPKALTSGRNCDYGVVLHNTSQIGIIRPDGNGGVDTTWEDLEANPEQCTWDFGDGTPLVNGFEPSHIYADTGTYIIKLHIQDFERICTSNDYTDTVHLKIDYTKADTAKIDTVVTCESKLPYYYKPSQFGYDNVTTKWDLNAVGTRYVSYSTAFPDTLQAVDGSDSIVYIRSWNGCDSIAKVLFNVLTPTVSISQLEDFCDSAKTKLIASANNVSEEDVEYKWFFMDSLKSETDELMAISDGTYSVHIIDTTTKCEASATYKIDPCVPNVFLPNCITPTRSLNEGPAQNDYFYLDQFVLRFISEVKFMVYARNGEQVCYYEGKKDASGKFVPETPYANLPEDMDGRLVLWDGTVNGDIRSGTYVYTLWIVSGGQSYLYKGKITVL